MAKPTYPKWVPDGDVAKISDPGEAKRALGFIYKEKPAFQHYNWSLYNFSQWIKGLQGSYFDVIVGSATQVTNNEATHNITDLNDALVIAGTKILILSGTHILTGNLTLSNANVTIIAENPTTAIDLASFLIVLSGDSTILTIRPLNAGANSVQLTGAGSHVDAISTDIAVFSVANGASARSTGTGGGLKFSTATLSDNRVMTTKAPEVFTGQKNFSPSVALTWGANVAWNLDTRQVAKLTLTGATAQLDNPTNMKDGGTYVIRIIQDATGGRALTFGTAYRWVNGVVPVIPQTANDETLISFISDGSNMDGVGQGPFS